MSSFTQVHGERRIVENGKVLSRREEKDRDEAQRKKDKWEKVLQHADMPKLEKELAELNRASYLAPHQQQRRNDVVKITTALKKRRDVEEELQMAQAAKLKALVSNDTKVGAKKRERFEDNDDVNVVFSYTTAPKSIPPWVEVGADWSSVLQSTPKPDRIRNSPISQRIMDDAGRKVSVTDTVAEPVRVVPSTAALDRFIPLALRKMAPVEKSASIGLKQQMVDEEELLLHPVSLKDIDDIFDGF